MARPGQRRPAQRGTRVLAKGRRASAAMPGGVAPAAAKHFLAASRRRPAAGRGGERTGGRVRNRKDAAALCDEQTQNVHGRLPRAVSGARSAGGSAMTRPPVPPIVSSTPAADDDRDAWLSEALRHAPDADVAPPAALSGMILRAAQAKARPAVVAPPRPPMPFRSEERRVGKEC